MYCSKCHKQSPDNFTSCAYCGAPFKHKKKPSARRFGVKEQKRSFLSSGKKSVAVVVFAAVIVLVSVGVGIFTGAKPGSIVKKTVKAVQNGDEALYCSVYDDCYKEYCRQNIYFDDAAVSEALASPMNETDEFYTAECGEGYKLHGKVKSVDYLSESELEKLNAELTVNYGYTKEASKAAKLNVEITAEGPAGKYTSVYKDYVCIRLGGKWYRCDFCNKSVKTVD